MTAAGTATVLLWVLLLAGLAGCTYFLLSNRPAHPGLVTVVTHGFPVAVALSYLRSIILLVQRDGPRWVGPAEIVSSLLTLLLVDAVVLAVVVVWRRYRDGFRAAERALVERDRQERPGEPVL
jgi:hypothetical protein